jgi:hypothetical protein
VVSPITDGLEGTDLERVVPLCAVDVKDNRGVQLEAAIDVAGLAATFCVDRPTDIGSVLEKESVDIPRVRCYSKTRVDVNDGRVRTAQCPLHPKLRTRHSK